MKYITSVFIGAFTLLSLGSCVDSDKEQITPYRGKVKFETISVTSKLAGRIAEIYVEEGDEVAKGDTLAYIDIPELNAKLMQVDGAIRAARGQLDMAANGATNDQIGQIEGKLDAANAQLKFAEESFGRMQAMYQDSLITQQRFDEVKMKLDMARAQVDALEAKRQEVAGGTRIEQITQARGQLDRAVGAKEEVLTAEGEKYVIAPADMTVETISLKVGELLSPGYTLVNGYEKGSLYFRFTVPESKVYNFKVGEDLTIVNPYTEEEVTGRIVNIKQLAKYADITSTAPLYELSEAIYELKVVPAAIPSDQQFFLNATVLIKE